MSAINTTYAPSKPSIQDTYRDAARQAAHSDPFTRAADLAFKDLQAVQFSVGASPASERSDRPRLTPPGVQLPSDPGQAKDRLTQILAQLLILLGEASSAQVQSRLQVLKSMAQSTTEGYQRQSVAYQEAVVTFEGAVAGASESEARWLATQADVQAAQTALAQADDALGRLDPQSASYAAARQAADRAGLALATVLQQLSGVQGEHQALLEHARASGSHAEQLADELARITVGPLPPALAASMKQQLDGGATLILLMMQFAELMSDSQAKRLETDTVLFRELQAARQSFLEEKAVEYAKAVEDAAKMSKIAGCIGKMVGGIVMLVGAVVAVAGLFTGGTLSIGGAALFAVGLTLTGGDWLIKELTGVSFMAAALSPLIDHVIMPLVKLVVDLVTQALQGLMDSGLLDFLNLPDNSALMAGAIIGTVVALVALIALVVVGVMLGGPAVSNVVSKLADKIAPTLAKMVPDIVTHLTTVVVQAIEAALKQIITALGSTKGQQLMNIIKGALVAVEASGTVSSSGFNAASGVKQKESSDALAEANLSQHDAEQLKDRLQQAIELAVQGSETFSQQIREAMDAMAHQNATALSIARKI